MLHCIHISARGNKKRHCVQLARRYRGEERRSVALCGGRAATLSEVTLQATWQSAATRVFTHVSSDLDIGACGEKCGHGIQLAVEGGTVERCAALKAPFLPLQTFTKIRLQESLR